MVRKVNLLHADETCLPQFSEVGNQMSFLTYFRFSYITFITQEYLNCITLSPYIVGLGDGYITSFRVIFKPKSKVQTLPYIPMSQIIK